MGYKVAVIGATGNVGREMLSILDERGFPADEVVALASRRSVGQEVSFGDKTLKVKALEGFDFSDTDIALMSAGGNISKEYSPKIGATGCVVIDNSSAWRYDQDVPLIVPEVNPDAIEGFTRKNIIANPNCSTAQLVVALKPLHEAAQIKRIVVSTYQSVSGAGKEGMDELFEQSRAVFVADPVEKKKFTKRIAFNVIPHIDVFMEDGSTKEEWKVMAETKKMLAYRAELDAVGDDFALRKEAYEVGLRAVLPLPAALRDRADADHRAGRRRAPVDEHRQRLRVRAGADYAAAQGPALQAALG